jgi:hypothetical protein
MPIYSKPYKTATYVSDDTSLLIGRYIYKETFLSRLLVNTATLTKTNP